jgi:hypothetical protein
MEAQMILAQASVGALVDLVQSRLSSMAISDREDRRERKFLQACLEELQKMRQALPVASVS